jgi:hypothetical protein
MPVQERLKLFERRDDSRFSFFVAEIMIFLVVIFVAGGDLFKAVGCMCIATVFRCIVCSMYLACMLSGVSGFQIIEV